LERDSWRINSNSDSIQMALGVEHYDISKRFGAVASIIEPSGKAFPSPSNTANGQPRGSSERPRQ
jgi:hypothetical protein